MEYVTLKSYDGSLVRVPFDKKEEYIKTQEEIKELLNNGKSIDEILKLLGDKNV